MRLTTKVVSSITDMEAAEMLVKSAEHFKARFDEIKERARELEIENAYLNKTLTDTRQLLDSRAAGLETYQRMAEAGGLVLSDRDDVEATYRRR
jgi:predicted nuclease with TOPRIM domain